MYMLGVPSFSYFQLQSCGTHQLGKSYEQNNFSGSSTESGIKKLCITVSLSVNTIINTFSSIIAKLA